MKTVNLLLIGSLETQIRIINLIQYRYENVNILGKRLGDISTPEEINTYNPDVLFMEIITPKAFTENLVSNLNIDKSKIVFVVNHENPITKILELASINYLTNPVSTSALNVVIEKVLPILEKKPTNTLSAPTNRTKHTLSLSTYKGYTLVNVADIVYINSSGNYCTVVMNNGEKITITKLLKYFENILPAEHFVRTHQSYIVNLNCISKLVNEDGFYILLHSKKQIPIARRRKTALLKKLGIKRSSN